MATKKMHCLFMIVSMEMVHMARKNSNTRLETTKHVPCHIITTDYSYKYLK